MKREIVTLHGRVQAVGFRETVLAVAREFDVAGTVRNRRSGALEIDAEGAGEMVDAFIVAVMERKPPFARIDHVERRLDAPTGATSFERAATG